MVVPARPSTAGALFASPYFTKALEPLPKTAFDTHPRIADKCRGMIVMLAEDFGQSLIGLRQLIGFTGGAGLRGIASYQ